MFSAYGNVRRWDSDGYHLHTTNGVESYLYFTPKQRERKQKEPSFVLVSLVILSLAL